MATFCSHCGEELPRDDARFCNNCGMMRTARLPHSSSSASPDNSPTPGLTPSKGVRTEMEGSPEQASSLSIRQQSNVEEPPAWMQNLGRKPYNNTQAQLAGEQQLEPSREREEAPARDEQPEHSVQQPSDPATHTTVMEHPAQSQRAAGSEQLDFPVLPATPQPLSPARELHVKVWPEGTTSREQPQLRGNVVPPQDVKHGYSEPGQPAGAPAPGAYNVEDLPTRLMESVHQASQADPLVDDAPTSPLLAVPEEQAQAKHKQNMYAAPPRKLEQAPVDVADIAHVNTVHLQAQQQGPPSLPTSPPFPGSYSPSSPPKPTPPSRSRKRLPLIMGASAVVLLLVLALSSWILLLQPFRVSSATDVQQSFSDAKLGISLRYPNGWKTPQVDYSKQIVTLRDASDTASMSLDMADAATTSPESYLQKRAAQIGISNAKAGTSSSFANSSWQNIQGDMQEKGAEYTCGLFVTVHKNRFYTMIQMAPRSVYTDEEKLVFSPTRLSLRFL